MSAFPYDDIDELTKYMENVNSKTPEVQKQALELLYSDDIEPVRFTRAMLTFMIYDSGSDENVLKLKRSASVTLAGYLKNKFDLTPEQKAEIVSFILEALFSDKLDFLLKPSLQPLLLLFYSGDAKKLKKEGFDLAKAKMRSTQLNDCYGSFIIVNTILNCSKPSQATSVTWFSYLLEGLCLSGVTIINGVILELQKAVQGGDQASIITNVFLGVTVLQVWMDIIAKFVTMIGKEDDNFDAKYVNIVVSQDDLLDVISKILILHIPNDQQIIECLFCTSGIDKIDELFNTLKSTAIETLNVLLDLIQENSGVSVDPQVNKFYGFMRSVAAKYLLDSVYNFCTQKDLDTVLGDNTKLQGALVEALKFLTKLTAQKELYAAFCNRRNQLVVDVCFPLIQTGAQELVDFQEDPDQFVFMALDVCQSQESETPKSQAVQFLEKMCENLDGVLTYVAGLCLQIIYYSIVYDKIEEIPEKFPRLKIYTNTAFLATTDKNIRIETCILILSNLSFLVTQREDLMHGLQKLFESQKSYFLSDQPTPLVHSRLCLFLGQYLEHLFMKPEEEQYYKEYLGFFVKCAGLEEEDMQGVAEQALNSLCIIFDPLKGPSQRLTPYLEDIVEQFGSYIATVDVPQFFTLIHEFTRTYETYVLSNPEPFLKFMTLLVQRAQEEYVEYKNGDSEASHIIKSLWNTIRNIAEKPNFVLNFQEQIEGILNPLLEHMEKDDNVPFEEDVLEYIVAVMRVKKGVTLLVWNVFKLFKKIMTKQDGMIWLLFQPMNYLIVYGKEGFTEEPDMVPYLIEMIITGLNPRNQKANAANVSEAAVLLQLSIQYLTLTNQLWEDIVLAALQKIKDVKALKNGEDVFQEFLIARLGGVLLCAFLTNFELTQAVVVHQNEVQFVMDLFIQNVLVFETHPYDRKVFLLSLTHFLQQENLNEGIVQRLPEVLKILIPVFKHVEYLEYQAASKVKALKALYEDDEEYVHRISDPDNLKRVLAGEDPAQITHLNGHVQNGPMQGQEQGQSQIAEENKHDDISDVSDGDEEFERKLTLKFTSEDMANRVLDQFETELKNQDEFAFFRQAVLTLKDTNPERIESLYEQLPPKFQNDMKDILQSKRIDDEIGKSQPRKIVKPRRRKIADVTLPPQ